MPIQILSTKLTIPPQRSRLVRRTRLVQKLDQGLEVGLVLVSAPAGYGKTTLLSAWLSQVDTPVAWLSLDETDNDPPCFLAYLAAALAGIDPALGEVLENSPNFRTQPEVVLLLTPLINLIAQRKRPFFLILDDYHLIHDQLVHQLVNFLLDHRPSPLHIVLSTRADPPFPLARMRARSEVIELRLADLRFRTREAAEFLDRTMQLTISTDDIASITARTEGWIAGLQIAALSMRNVDDVSGFIASLSGNDYYMFDYLMKEVISNQPPEIQRFLLYSSILNQLTPPLCDALLKDDIEPPYHPAADILQQLEHLNLFLIPLDNEHRWYRYHHLFSDLLKVILEQSYPNISLELHRRASAWYESQGALSEALQHALDSGDMQLVAQIVSTYVLALWESDEIASLLRKIDAMPLDQLVCVPWLGIARAWIVGIGDVQKTEQLLEDIELSLENTSEIIDRQLIKSHIAAARANYLSVRGDFDQVIIQAQIALSILPETETVLRARCLTLWGVALANSQNSPAAIPILEQALLLLRHANKPGAIMFTAAKLAGAYLLTGQLHYCQLICMETLEFAEITKVRFHQQLSTTAEIYSMLSRVHAEWGENDQAIEFARKGLALSERWGHQAFICTCLFYLGRALVFHNDMEEARRIFQRAGEIARKVSPWLWREIELLILDSLLDADPTLSIEIVSQVHQLKDNGVSLSPMVKARLFLREVKFDEALEALDQALVELTGKTTFSTVRIYALRALAYQAKRDEKQSLTALRLALELGEPENRIASFVREGEAMENLLRLARAKDITPSFVERILAAFAARNKPEVVHAPIPQMLPEPLSEREQQVLQLLAQGYANKQIASVLVVSNQTIHQHLKHIYDKLDVHSRTEAIVRARQLGLI